jgi:hypothetical protein
MADTEQEAQWRNEFEMLGYDEVRTHAYNGDYPQGHLKRQVALRWLRQKEIARDRIAKIRAQQTWHFIGECSGGHH